MLDLKFIRQEPDRVRAALKAKRSAVDLDRLLHLDGERRDLLTEVETLKAERNTVSRRIGEMKQRGEAGGVEAEMARMRTVGEMIDALDGRVAALTGEIDTLLAWIPNLPHESVPPGE